MPCLSSPASSRSLCQSNVSAGPCWAGSLHVDASCQPSPQTGRPFTARPWGGGGPRWCFPTALPSQGCRHLCALRARRLGSREDGALPSLTVQCQPGPVCSTAPGEGEARAWPRLQAGPAKGQPRQDPGPQARSRPLAEPVRGAALCPHLVRLSLSGPPLCPMHLGDRTTLWG